MPAIAVWHMPTKGSQVAKDSRSHLCTDVPGKQQQHEVVRHREVQQLLTLVAHLLRHADQHRLQHLEQQMKSRPQGLAVHWL